MVEKADTAPYISWHGKTERFGEGAARLCYRRKSIKHSNSSRKLPEERLQPRRWKENNVVRLLILCLFFGAFKTSDTFYEVLYRIVLSWIILTGNAGKFARMLLYKISLPCRPKML